MALIHVPVLPAVFDGSTCIYWPCPTFYLHLSMWRMFSCQRQLGKRWSQWNRRFPLVITDFIGKILNESDAGCYLFVAITALLTPPTPMEMESGGSVITHWSFWFFPPQRRGRLHDGAIPASDAGGCLNSAISPSQVLPHPWSREMPARYEPPWGTDAPHLPAISGGEMGGQYSPSLPGQRASKGRRLTR